MNAFSFSRKEGARLFGMIADGHNIVEAYSFEFLDAFRAMLRDVYAKLGHHLNRMRVHVRRFDSPAVDLVLIATKSSKQAFSDL